MKLFIRFYLCVYEECVCVCYAVCTGVQKSVGSPRTGVTGICEPAPPLYRDRSSKEQQSSYLLRYLSSPQHKTFKKNLPSGKEILT